MASDCFLKCVLSGARSLRCIKEHFLKDGGGAGQQARSVVKWADKTMHNHNPPAPPPPPPTPALECRPLAFDGFWEILLWETGLTWLIPLFPNLLDLGAFSLQINEYFWKPPGGASGLGSLGAAERWPHPAAPGVKVSSHLSELFSSHRSPCLLSCSSPSQPTAAATYHSDWQKFPTALLLC